MRSVVFPLALLCLIGHASDEQALLAAIGAHPDEDTPRLVYADWLEEHGQNDRAEFIRLSIELTRRGDRDSTDYEKKRTRADHLFITHGEEWTPKALRKIGRIARYGPLTTFDVTHPIVWRRGFVERVRLLSTDENAMFSALDEMPALDALYYVVGGESFQRSERVVSFVRLPLLSRIRTFGLVGDAVDTDWEQISPRLTNLKRLHLGGGQLTRRAIAHVIHGPHAQDLLELSVSKPINLPHTVSSSMVAPLFRATTLKSLETLGLGCGRMSSSELEGWSSPDVLPALTNLELQSTGIGEARAFIDHPRFQGISGLALRFRLGAHTNGASLADPIIKNGQSLTDLLISDDLKTDLPLALRALLLKNQERFNCLGMVSRFSKW